MKKEYPYYIESEALYNCIWKVISPESALQIDVKFKSVMMYGSSTVKMLENDKDDTFKIRPISKLDFESAKALVLKYLNLV